MPRKTIQLPDQIEYISVLDENGRLDNDLEPKLPNDLLLRLYHFMLLGRRFDERMLNLQRQGRIGTFPPIAGQEAAHLGAVAPMKPSDWMVPAFRETTAEIWRGRSMESILMSYNGYIDGGKIPEHVNNLPISIPVGSQILHATGLAFSSKYKKTDAVAMAFFGDGATSQGDFHEGLNFAGVYQLPAIFLCQNNHWAISIPRAKQTRSKTLAQKAIAYGIKGVQVDGNDILAVYLAADEAIQRARKGEGPTLIECVTYRFAVHTTADDPKRYRTDEEVEAWKQRDPLIRFRKYLAYKGLLNEESAASVEEEVKKEIQTAIDQAEAAMKSLNDPIKMFDHVYAELPPYVEKQKEAFIKELAEAGKGVNHG